MADKREKGVDPETAVERFLGDVQAACIASGEREEDGFRIMSEAYLLAHGDRAIAHKHLMIDGREYLLSLVPIDLGD